jgi:hypothetical protein
MSVQVIVVNDLCHSIKVVGHDFAIKCHKKHEYSVQIPISARHPKEYKIEADGKVIASLMIETDGLIRAVKNLTEKFNVFVKNNFHHRCTRPIRSYARYGLDVGDWQDGYLNALMVSGEPQVIIVTDYHFH